MGDTPKLECQSCGWVIRELSPQEARDMALHPYNWITFCGDCRIMGEEGR